MTNEETNKKVETVLAEVDEKIEGINEEQSEVSNRLTKMVKGLVIADRALSVLGVSLIVGAVIKESIK